MTDLLPGNVVFGQLIEESAGQDEIEELIELGCHRALGRLLPQRPPENREHLHSGQ
jgi:hypothetical protein